MSYARRLGSSLRRTSSDFLRLQPPNLKQFLPGLNGLAEGLLVARARREDVWERCLTVSRLVSLGTARDDCRDLIARRLAAADGQLGASSRIALTDAGLALLQRAIPLGAIRPIFDVASRKLIVAGETILRLAVQARNLCAVLTAFEVAGWAPRVTKPLGGRPCANDAHHIAVATHRLNMRQNLIDFHADDGSATWNWRPSGGPERRRELRSK